MSQTDGKARASEHAEPRGPQCCPDLCQQIMAGTLPDCCAAEMREVVARGVPEDFRARMHEMMSRLFETPEKAESKPEEAV